MLDAFAVVDTIKATGDTNSLRRLGIVMYECHCPGFVACVVIMEEKVLVCRKYTLRHSGMAEHWVGILLSNNPGKKNPF